MRQAASRFLPQLLVWTLSADGTIWFARSGELRLIHRNLVGDTIRIIETQHREATFTPQEEDLIQRACHDFRGDISPSDFEKPLVHAIHTMDDGHVLVQIAGEMKEPTPVLDVFDPDGRFLGSIDLGFPMEPRALHAFKGDTIVAVTLGALDVPYVVRATIRRPGG